MKKLSLFILCTVILASCGQEVPPRSVPSVKTEVPAPVSETPKPPAAETQSAPVSTESGSVSSVESNSGVIEQILTGVVSSSGSKNEISFSDAQIKEILAKIVENIEKQKSMTGTIFIQGEYKAEYIEPKDYSKEVDKIVTTIQGKKYELPGFHIDKKYSLVGIDCEKDNGIGPIPACTYGFYGFGGFSPSGYYLFVKNYWYEGNDGRLLDTKSGKVILEVGSPTFTVWANDKKQFIYGQSSAFSGIGGLYITKKDAFPETVEIYDHFVEGGYIDDKYIYIRATELIPNGEMYFLKIYSLSTLKEVFSKELK